MLKRFKLGLVAVLVVALAAAYGVPAMAKKDGKKDGKDKAEVQYNCKKSRVKPQHIEVGCDKRDERADLRRVKYRDRDYGDKRVRGKGDFSAGTGGSTKVNLRFKNLRKCKGDQVYRNVTVKFKNTPPSGHSNTEKYRFDC
jgi:hypothetical protein